MNWGLPSHSKRLNSCTLGSGRYDVLHVLLEEQVAFAIKAKGHQPLESCNRPLESLSRPLESCSLPLESFSRPLESYSHALYICVYESLVLRERERFALVAETLHTQNWTHIFIQVPYVCIACKTSIRKGLALRRYLNPLGISAASMDRKLLWQLLDLKAKRAEASTSRRENSPSQ